MPLDAVYQLIFGMVTFVDSIIIIVIIIQKHDFGGLFSLLFARHDKLNCPPFIIARDEVEGNYEWRAI